VHSVWEGALGAVVFSLVRLGMRRRAANVRYLAACAMLAVLLVAPIVTVFLMPETWRPAPVARAGRTRLSSNQPASPGDVGPVLAGVACQTSSVLNRVERLNLFLPWVVQIGEPLFVFAGPAVYRKAVVWRFEAAA
jgi:hypothetical protein